MCSDFKALRTWHVLMRGRKQRRKRCAAAKLRMMRHYFRLRHTTAAVEMKISSSKSTPPTANHTDVSILQMCSDFKAATTWRLLMRGGSQREKRCATATLRIRGRLRWRQSHCLDHRDDGQINQASTGRMNVFCLLLTENLFILHHIGKPISAKQVDVAWVSIFNGDIDWTRSIPKRESEYLTASWLRDYQPVGHQSEYVRQQDYGLR